MAEGKKAVLTITYDENGDVIDIIPASGKEVKKLEKDPFVDNPDIINGITTTTLVSKPGNSPCCVQIQGVWYCWC